MLFMVVKPLLVTLWLRFHHCITTRSHWSIQNPLEHFRIAPLWLVISTSHFYQLINPRQTVIS